MKVLLSAVLAAGLLAGCLGVGPTGPDRTSALPPGDAMRMVCENGNPPPCD